MRLLTLTASLTMAITPLSIASGGIELVIACQGDWSYKMTEHSAVIAPLVPTVKDNQLSVGLGPTVTLKFTNGDWYSRRSLINWAGKDKGVVAYPPNADDTIAAWNPYWCYQHEEAALKSVKVKAPGDAPTRPGTHRVQVTLELDIDNEASAGVILNSEPPTAPY